MMKMKRRKSIIYCCAAVGLVIVIILAFLLTLPLGDKEFVINFKELGLDNQDIKQRLMRSFNLAAEQATQAVQNK